MIISVMEICKNAREDPLISFFSCIKMLICLEAYLEEISIEIIHMIYCITIKHFKILQIGQGLIRTF